MICTTAVLSTGRQLEQTENMILYIVYTIFIYILALDTSIDRYVCVIILSPPLSVALGMAAKSISLWSVVGTLTMVMAMVGASQSVQPYVYHGSLTSTCFISVSINRSPFYYYVTDRGVTRGWTGTVPGLPHPTSLLFYSPWMAGRSVRYRSYHLTTLTINSSLLEIPLFKCSVCMLVGQAVFTPQRCISLWHL